MVLAAATSLLCRPARAATAALLWGATAARATDARAVEIALALELEKICVDG
jgi:hypothetical protein